MLAWIGVVAGLTVMGAPPPEAPLAGHADGAHAAMNARGAEAMGFDQDRATHHFRLTPEGGRIQVEANEARDRTTVERVAAHLRTIREAFASGDFRAPRHTHGEDPPGVTALKRLRGKIDYAYEAMPRGGRLVLATRDPDARAAIHEFLRYQIREHHTGDPLDVELR